MKLKDIASALIALALIGLGLLLGLFYGTASLVNECEKEHRFVDSGETYICAKLNPS